MATRTDASMENRRHPRFPVGAAFDVRLEGAPPSRCRALIVDLSMGGMTFQSDASLEEGMTLHLRLGPEFVIRGEVRNASGPLGGQRRYGIQFHKIGYAPA
ncbi:MAG: PilZ domain-containing protein [Elusimicrobia bacterium]|nr:PilZ domain-containing protein [Elusimicrobiota bacterium]